MYERRSSELNIWRAPGPKARNEGEPPVRLIASTRSDAWPSFSTDGQRIAFASNRSGPWELWIADQSGEQAYPLTSLAGASALDHAVRSPRWSPEGRRIAFTSTAGSGQPDIYAVDLARGVPRPLTTEPSWEASPSWSRNGVWVYFDKGGREIWKVPAASGEATPVKTDGGMEVIESPDGFLYYLRHGIRGIWRMSVEGGEESLVADLGLWCWAQWGVYDDGVCFVKNAGGDDGFVIECLDFATQRTRTVARLGPVTLGRGFSVSPDGEWILYVQHDSSGSDLALVESFR